MTDDLDGKETSLADVLAVLRALCGHRGERGLLRVDRNSASYDSLSF